MIEFESLSHSPINSLPLKYSNHIGDIRRQPNINDPHWFDMYQKIGPWEIATQLEDNIRSTVLDRIKRQIPQTTNQIPPLGDIKRDSLARALVHNWFEELPEGILKQRKGVLLSAMTGVARRMETTVYKKILSDPSLTDKQIHALGLTPVSRDLLIKLMDTGLLSNKLFVRFLAYSQKAPGVSDEIEPPIHGMKTHKHGKDYSLARLFPKETLQIARELRSVEEQENFFSLPGGSVFREYLNSIASYYRAQTPEDAKEAYDLMQDKFTECVKSDFPIILTPPNDFQIKSPYVDPELRISLRPPELRSQELYFQSLKQPVISALTHSYPNLGERAKPLAEETPIRLALAIGSYGVNLVFSGVAQENPIILYANEQKRAYDDSFKQYLNCITGSATVPMDNDSLMLSSQTASIFHELCHGAYPKDCPEMMRTGSENTGSFMEASTEILFRAILPEIVKSANLQGGRDAWAHYTLASALQLVHDNEGDDEYFRSGVYVINSLLDADAIEIQRYGNGKIQNLTIMDYDRFYTALKVAASNMVDFLNKPDNNTKKTTKWIAENLTPFEETNAIKKWMESKIQE